MSVVTIISREGGEKETVQVENFIIMGIELDRNALTEL